MVVKAGALALSMLANMMFATSFSTSFLLDFLFSHFPLFLLNRPMPPHGFFPNH